MFKARFARRERTKATASETTLNGPGKNQGHNFRRNHVEVRPDVPLSRQKQLVVLWALLAMLSSIMIAVNAGLL